MGSTSLPHLQNALADIYAPRCQSTGGVHKCGVVKCQSVQRLFDFALHQPRLALLQTGEILLDVDKAV